jgi:tRNA threonylcarbamoyladenosine biosynthesis protein TsaE
LQAELVSRSHEQTQAIGLAMGEAAESGDLFLLSGELGAGKTCLTQGVLWGLGVDDYARSPTFVLVSQHMGRLPMYHVDLYRLEDASETIELGLDEYVSGDGVCVVEWAERAMSAFPESRLEVTIEYVAATERRLEFRARGARYHRVVEAALRAAGEQAARKP